jgi:hypothetical protein
LGSGANKSSGFASAATGSNSNSHGDDGNSNGDANSSATNKSEDQAFHGMSGGQYLCHTLTYLLIVCGPFYKVDTMNE